MHSYRLFSAVVKGCLFLFVVVVVFPIRFFCTSHLMLDLREMDTLGICKGDNFPGENSSLLE